MSTAAVLPRPTHSAQICTLPFIVMLINCACYGSAESDSAYADGTAEADERFETRTALGRRVCGEFGVYDARGRNQLAGCTKALRGLDEWCQINLI